MGVDKPSWHIFKIDTNSVRDDKVGTLLTLAVDPMSAQLFPPDEGDEVEVVDEEGDRYLAVVLHRDGIWLGLQLDWSSCVPSFQMGPLVMTYRPAPSGWALIRSASATRAA